MANVLKYYLLLALLCTLSACGLEGLVDPHDPQDFPASETPRKEQERLETPQTGSPRQSAPPQVGAPAAAVAAPRPDPHTD